MTRTARELLESTTGKLAPDPHANRLLPLIGRGAARRDTLAALALEQRLVIAADRRAFLHLAERSAAEGIGRRARVRGLLRHARRGRDPGPGPARGVRGGLRRGRGRGGGVRAPRRLPGLPRVRRLAGTQRLTRRGGPRPQRQLRGLGRLLRHDRRVPAPPLRLRRRALRLLRLLRRARHPSWSRGPRRPCRQGSTREDWTRARSTTTADCCRPTRRGSGTHSGNWTKGFTEERPSRGAGLFRRAAPPRGRDQPGRTRSDQTASRTLLAGRTPTAVRNACHVNPVGKFRKLDRERRRRCPRRARPAPPPPDAATDHPSFAGACSRRPRKPARYRGRRRSEAGSLRGSQRGS